MLCRGTRGVGAEALWHYDPEIPMERHVTMRLVLAVSVSTLGPAFIAQAAAAQGCEPIRFSTPVNLGGEGQAYQRAREWQLTLAYRRLVSKEWFIGSEDRSALAPWASVVHRMVDRWPTTVR